MTTNRTSLVSLAAVAAVMLFAASAAQAADAKPDGKALFTTLKCNSCHSVTAQGIDVAKSDEGEDGEEAAKPNDLSDVGARRDAKWIADFLTKKTNLDGKPHRKKFAGTPAELDAVSGWLASLKKAK